VTVIAAPIVRGLSGRAILDRTNRSDSPRVVSLRTATAPPYQPIQQDEGSANDSLTTGMPPDLHARHHFPYIGMTVPSGLNR
jgi:hypothetical protein